MRLSQMTASGMLQSRRTKPKDKKLPMSEYRSRASCQLVGAAPRVRWFRGKIRDKYLSPSCTG